jgi:hypothetical protein
VDSIVEGSMQNAFGGAITVSGSIIVGSVFSNDHEINTAYRIDHSLFFGSVGISGGSGGHISNSIFAGGSIALGSDLSDPGTGTISGNIVVGSPESGIEIGTSHPTSGPSGPITLSGNLAIANAGHGIDAESGDVSHPQIIDGGHNHAFLNQTTPQCIGVAC